MPRRTSDLTASTTPRPTARRSDEVVFPVEGPNGIGLSPDVDTLYWAETHTGPRVPAVDRARGELAPARPARPRAACCAACRACSCSTRWRSTATAGSAWRRSSTAGSRRSRPTAPRSSTADGRPDDDEHLLRRRRSAHRLRHVVEHRPARVAPLARAPGSASPTNDRSRSSTSVSVRPRPTRADTARRCPDRRACREIGFFTVVGHGVPASTLDGSRSVTLAFFDLPLADRLGVAMPEPGYPYGYNPMRAETLNRSIGGLTSPRSRRDASTFGPIDPPPRPLEEMDERDERASTHANLWPSRSAPGFPPGDREAHLPGDGAVSDDDLWKRSPSSSVSSACLRAVHRRARVSPPWRPRTIPPSISSAEPGSAPCRCAHGLRHAHRAVDRRAHRAFRSRPRRGVGRRRGGRSADRQPRRSHAALDQRSLALDDARVVIPAVSRADDCRSRSSTTPTGTPASSASSGPATTAVPPTRLGVT